MTLRIKYILFLTVLHVTLVYAAYHFWYESKWIFIIAEVVVIGSYFFGLYLLRNFLQPYKLVRSGSQALKEGDFSSELVPSGHRDTDQLIELYNDIIRKLREERLLMEEQSSILEKLIHSCPVGIVLFNLDGQIDQINPPAASLLGRGDTEPGDFTADSFILEQIQDMHPGQSIILHQTKEGNRLKLFVDQFPDKGFQRKFAIIEDLTSEVLAAEKEAYGKVIRMMAHEVNNSMGAVNSILDTMMKYGFEHEDADRDLRESLGIAIERNKSLINFTDNFARVIRLYQPHKSRVDLNEIAEKAVILWKLECQKRDINIQLEASPKASIIRADAIQLEQVIHNCIKNAIESIDTQGSITLKVTHDPTGFAIIDDGPGIPQDLEDQLYQPFFSTKVNGQGIGLMICREVARLHGGRFLLYSDRDSGLTYSQFEVVQSIDHI